ncbi:MULTISPECIES: hypothetical protein [Streptomyces]|nr:MULTISPECIES: hypothetical protein [Streptomyces]
MDGELAPPGEGRAATALRNGHTHPDGHGPDIAAQINSVVHDHLCPTY